MKVIIASFTIAKQGGIVQYVHSMIQAFTELGHKIDIVELAPSGISEANYKRKFREIESGEYQRKIVSHSQSGGYCLDTTSGYYFNTYYGYFLPPSNKINVFEADALEKWFNLVEDADIILWNFMPTKTKEWQKRGVKFDYWWRFFDLPSSIRQVFLTHDAYFNVRASNVTALKKKILFLGCAHLAAYQCCSEIGIRRSLLLNPRYIPKGTKMPIVPMEERETDFFAAHMFKPMKHMEELIAAIPYINRKSKDEFSIVVAGTGIEYSYMTSEDKLKSVYVCSKKRDPDLPDELDGKISLWNRALESGMEYRGQMSGDSVYEQMKKTKFAIDPSWADHYAQYCRTHINGFIIEAMMLGAYPVLRDYRGLKKSNNEDIYDPLFESIRAVIVPWDATPKQFAKALRKAAKEITPEQFLRDTKHNFKVVEELFNARKNAEEIIRLCKGGRKLVKEELEKGVDSENVKRISKEIMTDFFGIELPIQWET